MSAGSTTLTPEELDEAHARIAAIRDGDIDYSDIPPLTDRGVSVRLSDFPDHETARAEARRLYWAKHRAAE